MNRAEWNFRGIAVSIILAVGTLSTFAKLQLAGPEGTVTRYISAVIRQDWDTASRFCVDENPQDFATNFTTVTSTFVTMFRLGSKFDIVDVVRSNHRARAGIVFYLRDGRELPYIVALIKARGKWAIDLRRTARPYVPSL